MLLSKTMTIINLLGAIVSFISLALTMKRYQIAPKIQVYVFLSFTSMVLLMWTQLLVLSTGYETKWLVKTATTFWWAKTLYFSWAVRFSSLKK